MPSTPTIRLLLALMSAVPCFGADTPKTASVSVENDIKSAWQSASLGLFNEAVLAFAKLPGDEARLGEATSLLLRQPKTDSNIDRAAVLLADLVKNSSDPELTVAARYYLGRIEQTHRASPKPAEAARIFRELIAAHPGHPYAELATIKLAILDLHEQLPDAELRSRFDSYAALAPTLKSPECRRDLCLLLADSAQRFNYDPVITLDLLLVADRVGIARRLEQSHVWVRIGQLAHEAGRHEIARNYYTRFLATFSRDNRRLMISQRLAALPPETTGTKEAAK